MTRIAVHLSSCRIAPLRVALVVAALAGAVVVGVGGVVDVINVEMFTVGVGNARDVLVVARAQNLCARPSAMSSSLGQFAVTHDTIAGANRGL